MRPISYSAVYEITTRDYTDHKKIKKKHFGEICTYKLYRNWGVLCTLKSIISNILY